VTRSIGRTHRLIRLAAAGAALVTVALASGCGAGQLAQTSQIVAAVPGGSATAPVPNPANPTSEILVQNATIAFNGAAGYKVGDTAPLSIFVFNQTQDKLTVVPGSAVLQSPTTGKDAGSAGKLAWTGSAVPSAPPTVAPSATPIVSPSKSGAASGAPSESPSESPSPTVAPSVPPAPPLTVQPAGSAALIPGSTQYLAITNLTQAIGPGDVVNVTLNFISGGKTYSVTVGATVAPPTQAPSAP